MASTAEGAAMVVEEAAVGKKAMLGIGACATEDDCGSSDGWAVGTFELQDNKLDKDALQTNISSVKDANDARLESLKVILKPPPMGGGKRRRTRKSNKKKKSKKSKSKKMKSIKKRRPTRKRRARKSSRAR